MRANERKNECVYVRERERLDEIKRKIEKDNRKTVQIYRCLIRECVCVRELVRV